MNDYTIKHLEFIQNTITRLNTNSFHIKALYITILAALLGIYVSLKNPLYLFIPIPPSVLFWFLDAYYLQQERKFREIYNDVAGLSKDEDKIIVRNFEMPLQKYSGKQYSFMRVFLSKTIWPIYCIPSLILLIAGILFSTGIVKISFGAGN